MFFGNLTDFQLFASLFQLIWNQNKIMFNLTAQSDPSLFDYETLQTIKGMSEF